MSLHVKHPQIGIPRWQFGSLALAAAVVITPVLGAAHETTTSHPPTSSSMPMDHAGMDHMKTHEDMGHMKGHEGMSMTGDVDFDFAVNMRKHHQMALLMSEAQLKNGKDAEMRRMATHVIAAQKKEIAELDRWIETHEVAKATQSAD